MRGDTIVVIEVVGHEITTQRQNERLGSGKAQRRQEIALDQGIALAICHSNGHTRLTQCLDVTVDCALADLKACCKIFSATVAPPVPLELKDNCQQAIGAIHIFEELMGFVTAAAIGGSLNPSDRCCLSAPSSANSAICCARNRRSASIAARWMARSKAALAASRCPSRRNIVPRAACIR